jgi:hypothetical protein
MTVSPELITTMVFAFLGTAGGTIIWGIRLEGRVDKNEILYTEREKYADERHEDVTERLSRIEQKLDALGGRGGDSNRVQIL